MRSAPPSTAASNTLREPSTLIAWLSEPPPMMANARCTTTSAPFTASRTLALSCTSPWRYSVFFQPSLSGSNGRRAMPTIFFTRRERSRADTSAIPRSPVGPVTATVSPSAAIAPPVISDADGRGRPASALPGRPDRLALLVLAADQLVELVGLYLVLAGAAAHDVALAVGHVDLVVARPRGDVILARPADHGVGAAARYDPVVARAATGVEAAGAGRRDLVVAGAAVQRRDLAGVGGVAAHPVGAVAAACEVAGRARVEAVVAGAAEEPVVARLAEQHVVAVLAEHRVVSRARVCEVDAATAGHRVVAGAADHE